MHPTMISPPQYFELLIKPMQSCLPFVELSFLEITGSHLGTFNTPVVFPHHFLSLLPEHGLVKTFTLRN